MFILVKHFENHYYIELTGWLALAILLIYLLGVYIITIGIRSYEREISINVIPLYSIKRIVLQIMEAWSVGGIRGLPQHKYNFFIHCIRNIIGNFFLILPIGYLYPIVRKKTITYWHIMFLGVAISLLIEITQYSMHRGYFDVDDIVLNVVGCIIGKACFNQWLHKAADI